MDKQFFKSTAAVVGLIILSCAAFASPYVFRTQMVIARGVLFADSFKAGATIVGFICLAVAATLAVIRARQLIASVRADRTAALEAKLWDDLPSRDETDLGIIEPALQRIAKRYPDATDLIEITLKQINSIQNSLEKIGDILEKNAGLLSQETDKYGSAEYLIKGILAGICPGLVRIIYQAHEPDNSNTFVPSLVKVVKIVNDENQTHVDATRELADGVVSASTQGDTESIQEQVLAATKKLNDTDTTTEKEGWLTV